MDSYMIHVYAVYVPCSISAQTTTARQSLAETMPVGAKYFQAVMDVMKKWSMDNMLSKMVNGKYAIEDTDNQLIRYVTGYCSKPQLE